MKEKRFQILSLALNVVLLIALFVTRGELRDTGNALKNELSSVSWRLLDTQDQIMELSEKLRKQTKNLSDFSFEPTGLDPESHTLQADMSITLRRWTADTEVTLLVTQSGRITEQPMSGSGGVFTTPVSLPVEDTGEVSFAANITAGGQTSREEVTSYSDLAMLLPLVSIGNGSVTGPSYGKETACMEIDFDVGLEKQYGAEAVNPVFQIRKNGKAVQEVSAKISEQVPSNNPPEDYYAPDTAENKLEIPCQPSDTVEIHLLCRDSFGLSYDFTVCTYEIDRDGTIVEEVWPVTDYNVRVFWEK